MLQNSVGNLDIAVSYITDTSSLCIGQVVLQIVPLCIL